MSQIIIIILCLLGLSPIWSTIISAVLSSGVMYGKELIYDKILGHGVYNIKDFIAGEVGIGYGIISSILFLIL